VNPNLAAQPSLAPLVGHTLWLEQLKAMGLTIALAVVGTAVLAWLVSVTIGLRTSSDVERQGLDVNEHGEEGYIFEEIR
jgi:Amt family ammonium transporter